MDNRSVFHVSGDGGKTQIVAARLLTAALLQIVCCRDFGNGFCIALFFFVFCHRLFQPADKLYHGDAVFEMGIFCAGDFGFVLQRLHQFRRIAAGDHFHIRGQGTNQRIADNAVVQQDSAGMERLYVFKNLKIRAHIFAGEAFVHDIKKSAGLSD